MSREPFCKKIRKKRPYVNRQPMGILDSEFDETEYLKELHEDVVRYLDLPETGENRD